MLIDFSTPIKNLDDNPIKEAGDKVVTIGSICEGALMANHEGDEKLAGPKKVERFELAVKIHGGGEVDISAEHIVELKKLVAVGYTTLVVARVFEVLDPKAE